MEPMLFVTIGSSIDFQTLGSGTIPKALVIICTGKGLGHGMRMEGQAVGSHTSKLGGSGVPLRPPCPTHTLAYPILVLNLVQGLFFA